MRRVLALAFLFGHALAQQTKGYAFFLDGERFEPQVLSLEGTPDAPRAGELQGEDRALVEEAIGLLEGR